MIGLSNAPLFTFQAPAPTASSGLGSAQTIPGLYDLGINSFNIQTFGGTLAYPLDVPKYIITFSISEYTRADLGSVGTFKPSQYPGIIMPLPRELVNNDHVLWQETEVGTMPGAFINLLAGASQQNAGPAAGVDLGILSTTKLAGGLIGGDPAGGVQSLMGISPNQFVVMLMRGPTYRRHTFTWELSPTNFKEADNLRLIINTIKNAMAPNSFGGPNGSPILWTFPKIFYVRLYPNSKFMYKFKPCVCDKFTVNYTPGSRAAFDKNGTGTIGDNPPANIQLNMHLIELEFWTEGNVTNTNNPAQTAVDALTNPSNQLGINIPGITP